MKHSILFCLFLVIACKNSNPDSASIDSVLELAMLGTWKNVSLKITYPEPDSIYRVPEGSWEKVLGIKPILTTYTSDGNYTSDYYNLQDSLVHTSSGQWKVTGDSLFLTEAGITTGYQVDLEPPRARFVGYLDWDQDGQADDLYDGVQEKVDP